MYMYMYLYRPIIYTHALRTQYLNQGSPNIYILDLILTTDETLVNKVKVGEIFNRSDHQIIRWTLSVGEPMMEESQHRKFNYFKADYDLVRLKMRGKDLERWTKDASVNESWNSLKKSLNEVIEETIARAVGMVKKRPWVTRKVQKKGGRSKELGENTVS